MEPLGLREAEGGGGGAGVSRGVRSTRDKASCSMLSMAAAKVVPGVLVSPAHAIQARALSRNTFV